MILPLNAELKETSLFTVLLIKIFVSRHQIQKSPYLYPQFFCLFFLVFKNTPIPSSWWMPSSGQKFFFYFCFLSLPFFPFSSSVTYTMAFFCYKPIGYIFHQPWIFVNCSITHFLCLLLVGYIFQRLFSSAHYIITHFLCLVLVGYII